MLRPTRLGLSLGSAEVTLRHILSLTIAGSFLLIACGARTSPDSFVSPLSAAGGAIGTGGEPTITSNPETTYCTIDGIVYGKGAANPADPSTCCQPFELTTSWSTSCNTTIGGTGGATGTGGTVATLGGVSSIGGAKSTGGSPATGGKANTGGAPPTGGVASTGGTITTGGTSSAGGSQGTGCTGSFEEIQSNTALCVAKMAVANPKGRIQSPIWSSRRSPLHGSLIKFSDSCGRTARWFGCICKPAIGRTIG